MKHLELYESTRKYFDVNQIKYYTKLWNTLHFKYTTNPFFSKLWHQFTTEKYLSEKQWIELEYLLKNGRTRYEAGILPSNY